ncbi:hypothetical protein CP03DC29_0379A, partial [Chlamydia psittaci 03DC29]
MESEACSFVFCSNRTQESASA